MLSRDTGVVNLSDERKWVLEHYEPHARHLYETLAGKLELLRTIVDSKWAEPNEAVKLQCLGVTLGDALAQELGMRLSVRSPGSGRGPTHLCSISITRTTFPPG